MKFKNGLLKRVTEYKKYSNDELEKVAEENATADIILSMRKVALIDLLSQAKEQRERGAFGKSLLYLNEYVSLSEIYGEIIDQDVFDQMLDDALNLPINIYNPDEALVLCDDIIFYYKGKSCVVEMKHFVKRKSGIKELDKKLADAAKETE